MWADSAKPPSAFDSIRLSACANIEGRDSLSCGHGNGAKLSFVVTYRGHYSLLKIIPGLN